MTFAPVICNTKSCALVFQYDYTDYTKRSSSVDQRIPWFSSVDPNGLARASGALRLLSSLLFGASPLNQAGRTNIEAIHTDWFLAVDFPF